MRHLWLVGVVVYVVAASLVGWRSVLEAFTSLRTGPLGSALGVLLLAQWTRALKWRWALGNRQDAIGLYFLSKLGGAISPMRIGELSPLLLRRHRSPRLGAWIVLDRLLEMAATLALGVVGIVALGLARHGLFPYLAVAACVLVVLPAYAVTRRRVFVSIASRSRRGTRVRRMSLFVAGMSGEMLAMRSRAPFAAMVTVFATCLDLYAGILLCTSFGFPIPFALAATAQCAHGLTTMVPFTPNATLVPYLAAATLLNRIGGIPTQVLAALAPVAVAANSAVFWPSFGLGVYTLRKVGS